ncbi:hypothetical protein ACFSHR_00075 [Azotobacter chroococcum]
MIEAAQAARVLVGQAKAAQAREDQARREARSGARRTRCGPRRTTPGWCGRPTWMSVPR